MNVENMKKHVDPYYALLAERMGKALSPQYFSLHCKHFVDCRLSADSVIQAIEDIALRWSDTYNWPTAEYIATRAKQIQREAYQPAESQAWRERENNARLEDQRKWDDRERRATEWADANPQLAAEIAVKAKAQVAKRRKDHPDNRAYQSEEFQRWSVLGALLRGEEYKAWKLAKEERDGRGAPPAVTAPKTELKEAIAEVVAA